MGGGNAVDVEALLISRQEPETIDDIVDLDLIEVGREGDIALIGLPDHAQGVGVGRLGT